MHSGPPLVNGRGPLDGFLSRRCPAPSNENVVVDLTSESSLSPVKCLASPAPASTCLSTKEKHRDNDKTASSGKHSDVDHTPEPHTLDCTAAEKVEAEEVDELDENQTASISQLETTQDSESESEEKNESGNVSSLGNKSALSISSVSSLSESSPEKTVDSTPGATPTVCISIPSCLFYSIQLIGM